ncbi:XdhC family protein [Streptomyces sp. enrichment culture]|uniref:XdhC family protein n=1 Tax=Streptomyces sp. enrichment culture TaxID=1795815 RepID=UPI003F554415
MGGNAPRGPGAALAAGRDGTVTGSVPGCCVEGAVYGLCVEALADGMSGTGPSRSRRRGRLRGRPRRRHRSTTTGGLPRRRCGRGTGGVRPSGDTGSGETSGLRERPRGVRWPGRPRGPAARGVPGGRLPA